MKTRLLMLGVYAAMLGMLYILVLAPVLAKLDAAAATMRAATLARP